MGNGGGVYPTDGSSMVGEQLLRSIRGVREGQVKPPYTTIGILKKNKSCEVIHGFWYLIDIRPGTI